MLRLYADVAERAQLDLSARNFGCWRGMGERRRCGASPERGIEHSAHRLEGPVDALCERRIVEKDASAS